MAESERENIRESTLEGLDTAARKGKHGGRPVITDDMLHTVLRRRALGESVEQIQPDLIIPTGKRKGQSPSVAGIYRALAEHAKREAYVVTTATDNGKRPVPSPVRGQTAVLTSAGDDPTGRRLRCPLRRQQGKKTLLSLASRLNAALVPDPAIPSMAPV
ncbi:hypothetical protein [Streptomyces sp. NPDC050988]|uniref:hypothetical protein n=1 Tax=Streptomyces sp. NPDC050988 TaxID=3365637 RepID=UPI0037969819